MYLFDKCFSSSHGIMIPRSFNFALHNGGRWMDLYIIVWDDQSGVISQYPDMFLFLCFVIPSIRYRYHCAQTSLYRTLSKIR